MVHSGAILYDTKQPQILSKGDNDLEMSLVDLWYSYRKEATVRCVYQPMPLDGAWKLTVSVKIQTRLALSRRKTTTNVNIFNVNPACFLALGPLAALLVMSFFSRRQSRFQENENGAMLVNLFPQATHPEDNHLSSFFTSFLFSEGC